MGGWPCGGFYGMAGVDGTMEWGSEGLVASVAVRVVLPGLN